MDESGFRGFLKEGKRVPPGLSEKTIRSHIAMVHEFESFLGRKRPPKRFEETTEDDLRSFIGLLAKDGRGKFDELLALLRYSRFVGAKDAELAMLVMLDGGNILDLLCDSVKDKYGKKRHDELLGDFVRPPIGTSFKLLPRRTREFMDRLEKGIGEEKTRDVLLVGVHAGPRKYYADEEKLFKESKDVNDYLRRRRRKFVDELEGHMKAGTRFFTQEIDQDVLDYLKKNRGVGVGVRKGNQILHTKIPYMTIEYLREKDPRMKRYYYCHCPLARESILSGEKISRNFCYCSAGYTKVPFEVAFGMPLKAKVTKSVLWGDPVCQFSIEIPDRILKGKAK